jgi:hypothetical protein
VPGIQDFTYLNFGKETVRGTPVAPTRKWIGDATGVLGPDLSLNFHEGENRGRRATMFRVTQQAEDVVVKVRADATFDDWVWPLTQLKGGMTGAGGAADKTWAAAPSMTALNNQEAYSLDIGDDTQNFRAQYAMWRWFTQKASVGDVTSLEGELFAQRVQKVAKATPADPASSPKLVGDLWTIKFATTFAGLAGASVQTNFITDHELHVDTGLVWHHYQDGTYFGGQHIETSFGGTLKMTVESTALAISELYDKWYAQTVDYIRLKNTSPVVLGGSFPSLQHDFAVAYSKVVPIGDEQDGVNLYQVEANLIDDGTNPLISPTLVCSLTAIP